MLAQLYTLLISDLRDSWKVSYTLDGGDVGSDGLMLLLMVGEEISRKEVAFLGLLT